MPAQHAVFGQPIAHSLSPRIHAAFGAQCAIALDYRAIEADCAHFADRLASFARDGGSGANVTAPLKRDALAVCATLGARARRCGSVNTLRREGDTWHGDSTDGAGLLRDLAERHAFSPRDQRVLLLGAGGAARAVAFALVDAGVGKLHIANRTPPAAQALADALGDAKRVSVVDWRGALAHADVDLVLHATAAGHAGSSSHGVAWDALLPTPAPATRARDVFAPQTLCYDLAYGEAARGFLAWARAAGARRASDGLGMLVEQAAESFALWHGVRPRTDAVYAELRALWAMPA